MFHALGLALADLGDRRVLAVLARTLAVTLLLFAAAGVAIGWGLRGVDPCGWVGDGGCPLGGGASGIGAVVLTLLAAWLLFPAVALGVVTGYADRVVGAIEARDYPAAARAPLGWGVQAGLGLRAGLRLFVYNLVALPLYLLLLVTGVGPAILAAAVNGLAYGRDLGEVIAARHLPAAERRGWLRATRGERLAIGLLVGALLLVPFLNLVAPLLGAAAITHLYHGRR